VSYCSSCGEPGEGRFCRMCGAPYAEVPAQAVTAAGFAQTTALPQADAPLSYLPPHRPTHAQPVDAGFDALFRRPEGELNPHSRTQMLPPVDADYRMSPPGGQTGVGAFGAVPPQSGYPQAAGGYPPGPGQGGEEEDWNDDEPGLRKPVIWGAIAAVVAASAVILGLLYIGSHNTGAAAAGSTTTSSAPNNAGANASPTIGGVNLPVGSAPASPSASGSPSASASASQSATGSTTLPLSIGSTGTYVQYVQTRLRQLGYYHGTITKQYDQATADAVTTFQAHAGVTGDPSGTVGRSTLTALIAAGTKPALRPGQHSADVRRLQEALNAAGVANIAVTSRYDEATLAAVMAYQQQVNITPTGMANAQTWAALQSGTVV
jgi:peptidoglycan hydrolase-like protein with peptidoglycan-binding domain